LATPVGSAFITINEDTQGNPMEIFINVGKAGSDVAAMAEALGRTLSTSLRFGSFLTPKEKAQELAHQLSGIGGRRSVGFGPNKILSLPDAVSIALSFHYGFKINGNLAVGASLYGAGSTVVAESSPRGISDPAADAVSYKATLTAEEHIGDICPSCGASALVYEEGCSKCHACGHSEC
jgi:ribonucleoside-diphosphate reductase alpha chain